MTLKAVPPNHQPEVSKKILISLMSRVTFFFFLKTIYLLFRCNILDILDHFYVNLYLKHLAFSLASRKQTRHTDTLKIGDEAGSIWVQSHFCLTLVNRAFDTLDL